MLLLKTTRDWWAADKTSVLEFYCKKRAKGSDQNWLENK